jgi:peptidoglycan/xylan/chitin deacetylase (PgdA/CDA1 family)
MNRLLFSTLAILLLLSSLARGMALASEVAITMDDPEVAVGPLMTPVARNAKILAALDKHHAKAMLFVCGKRIDNDAGRKLLTTWDEHGHGIANHTYSHLSLNDAKLTLEEFEADLFKLAPLIAHYEHTAKFFRFPFLKEGDTAAKRDGMRTLLKEKGFRNGAVSIDASDWAINDRLLKRLKEDPKADLSRYKVFYLSHIWKRAEYYDGLAKKVFGREIKHTLLIHHNLLNALFLDDLLAMFEAKGWKIISASVAYEDPIFERPPATLPAGESIVWAAAKETGKYDAELRYPGEDEPYERPEMDRFGL